MPLFDAICPDHGEVEVLAAERLAEYPCEEIDAGVACRHLALDLGLTGSFAVKMGGGVRKFVASVGRDMTESELDAHLQATNTRVLTSSERQAMRIRAAERVERVAKARGYSSYGALKDALRTPGLSGIRDRVAAARERTSSEYASKYGTDSAQPADSAYWRDKLPAAANVSVGASGK